MFLSQSQPRNNIYKTGHICKGWGKNSFINYTTTNALAANLAFKLFYIYLIF